ncbi:20217_t:CDS:1, partial [Gigaspora rosea]
QVNSCKIFYCNCNGRCACDVRSVSRYENTTCNTKECAKCIVAAVTCGIACIMNGEACTG